LTTDFLRMRTDNVSYNVFMDQKEKEALKKELEANFVETGYIETNTERKQRERWEKVKSKNNKNYKPISAERLKLIKWSKNRSKVREVNKNNAETKRDNWQRNKHTDFIKPTDM